MDCPFCAEDIKDQASVCKHCGRDLLAIRPLLEANQALSKRIDALERQLADLEEAQARVHHHVGLADGRLPSIHRGSAIAFALLWIFVAILFVSAAVGKHGAGMSPSYVVSALIVLPLIFGFLCQNIRTHPSGSDLTAALLVTVVSLIEIQVIRWELIDGNLIPQGWALHHPAGELPPDSWATLLFNASTIFLSFTAGVYFRYWMQSRRRGRHAPITHATRLSTYLVSRQSSTLSAVEIEDKIKRMDAVIHSVTGIAAAAGAVITYLLSHVHSTTN
jgi:hypothetical protein